MALISAVFSVSHLFISSFRIDSLRYCLDYRLDSERKDQLVRADLLGKWPLSMLQWSLYTLSLGALYNNYNH